MNKYLFQDFLFNNMPIKDDYPDVKVEYTDSIDNCIDIMRPVEKNHVAVGLSYLLRLEKESAWNDIVSIISRNESVTIVDDLELKNSELKPYKDFYLASYYWYLSQHSKCHVYKGTR